MELKLLVLAPFPPRLDALHGGARAMAHLIVEMAHRHRVGLLYQRTLAEPLADEKLLSHCDVVEEVVYSSTSTTVRKWIDLLRGKPLWASEWYAPSFATRLETLVANWGPDIIQTEYHIMGQYLFALDDRNTPRILVQHDPGTAAALREWRVGQAPGRVVPLLNVAAWYRFEKSVMRQVDAIVAFTERDRETLRRLSPGTPVVRIPLGATVPERPLNALGHPPRTVLFVGNFMHTPNVDAATRLLRTIFPRVRHHVPEARLCLVGDAPTPELRDGAGEHVTTTGRVPDVTPYLDSAAVVAVPLRLGGGMRVKVLEAICAGKAVVASRLAVEGIDVKDGKQILLAESDDEFIRALIDVLTDPNKRLSLGREARAWAQGTLNWKQIADSYDQLYGTLLHS